MWDRPAKLILPPRRLPADEVSLRKLKILHKLWADAGKNRPVLTDLPHAR